MTRVTMYPTPAVDAISYIASGQGSIPPSAGSILGSINNSEEGRLMGGSGGSCPVGGTPATITDGGATLRTAGGALESAIKGVSSNCKAGGTAAEDADIVGALTRFEAALSQYLDDLSTQVTAAATLAYNGAHDLTTAGGGN